MAPDQTCHAATRALRIIPRSPSGMMIMRHFAILTLAILLFGSLANASVSAAKPLTTIAYTELCTENNLCIPQFVPEEGLMVGGVTYLASPDPSDELAFALYGDPTFLPGGGIPADGPDSVLENPVLSGTGAMKLTLVFDKPTNVISFAVAIPKSEPKGVAVVTLYGPGTPGKIVFQGSLQPNVPGLNDAFLGTQFVYKKAAVKYAVLAFSQPFALDNLQFHE